MDKTHNIDKITSEFLFQHAKRIKKLVERSLINITDDEERIPIDKQTGFVLKPVYDNDGQISSWERIRTHQYVPMPKVDKHEIQFSVKDRKSIAEPIWLKRKHYQTFSVWLDRQNFKFRILLHFEPTKAMKSVYCTICNGEITMLTPFYINKTSKELILQMKERVCIACVEKQGDIRPTNFEFLKLKGIDELRRIARNYKIVLKTNATKDFMVHKINENLIDTIYI